MPYTGNKIVNELMQESVRYQSRAATENIKENLSKQQDKRAQTVRRNSNEQQKNHLPRTVPNEITGSGEADFLRPPQCSYGEPSCNIKWKNTRTYIFSMWNCCLQKQNNWQNVGRQDSNHCITFFQQQPMATWSYFLTTDSFLLKTWQQQLKTSAITQVAANCISGSTATTSPI